MTKGPIKNLAASVHQRLMNVAKRESRRFNDVLQHFVLERWLFRLSQSPYRDVFVLKGALLFVVWNAPTTRPTRDIDFLGRLNNDLLTVRDVIAEVCRTAVEADGLTFDPMSVKTDRVAEDADYEGVRATFQATLGTARIAMQIDIGFSDVITPAAVRISFPTILELPAAELLAYNRETAIAEKFEAMVKLGEVNSRMKDFFDIALLAQSFEFDGKALAAAIRATFDRRQTTIQVDPICFSARFAGDVAKMAQWNAFVRRSAIGHATAFSQAVVDVRNFLRPVALRLANQDQFAPMWAPGGPWR